ncbi:S46 family peptidase [bacterium]|nr:MAG: S46 family peptidase [bacterium]
MIMKRLMALLLVISGMLPLRADEGMYPISEIRKLNLRPKGLQLETSQIFSMDSIGIAHAIVMVGGCTGSFVSPEGLILTNHHCAFGAVQNASNVDNDYIQNGFYAKSRAEEIPAKGYTARIMESYRDVSAEVLGTVNDSMEWSVRSRTITSKMRAIAAQTEKQYPGKSAEVAEMVIGQSYVLFIYAMLRDIRMVYVPPRSVGEFGGEADNWVWPRHTGDFSFLRAYVAPDGSPSGYSPENIPYTPKKHLKVHYEGADENDFVFILGYPGRTFRHRTSDYLQYEEDIRLPYVAQWYDWQIGVMESMGKEDRAVEILLASRIKSLANTMKNYKGKLKGMNRLGLVKQKRNEDRALQSFIDTDAVRQKKYGGAIKEIRTVYEDMKKKASYEATLDFLGSSRLFNLYYLLNNAIGQLQKPDSLRSSAFQAVNWDRTRQSLLDHYKNHHEPTDQLILTEMLYRASALPADERIEPLDELLKGKTSHDRISEWVRKAYVKSNIRTAAELELFLKKTPGEMEKLKDPMIDLVRRLTPLILALRETKDRRDGVLNKYYGLYAEAKQMYQKADFIPDANRTLRFTYGFIRGYAPADATYHLPFTTVSGIKDKTTGTEPFDTPTRLLDLFNEKKFGLFKHKRLNNLPVAMLYNTDTTGGNSGSPVLNARGELIGLNFDRTFEATVNDYAWSEAYSRSIGVDVRYVLWVTSQFGGAGHLLQEMNVPLQ